MIGLKMVFLFKTVVQFLIHRPNSCQLRNLEAVERECYCFQYYNCFRVLLCRLPARGNLTPRASCCGIKGRAGSDRLFQVCAQLHVLCCFKYYIYIYIYLTPAIGYIYIYISTRLLRKILGTRMLPTLEMFECMRKARYIQPLKLFRGLAWPFNTN